MEDYILQACHMHLESGENGKQNELYDFYCLRKKKHILFKREMNYLSAQYWEGLDLFVTSYVRGIQPHNGQSLQEKPQVQKHFSWSCLKI